MEESNKHQRQYSPAPAGSYEHPPTSYPLTQSNIDLQALTLPETGFADHLEDPDNPAVAYSTYGDLEMAPGNREPDIHQTPSSGDELPCPQVLRGGAYVPEIRDLSPSSVGSPYREDGQDELVDPLPQLTDQDVDIRPGGGSNDDSREFDYRSKLGPLSIQEIRSFVFHDITVTHHVPRIAVQQFASLHTEDAPFDARTTREHMQAVTGLGEVRYDCCPEGCISYALPRYANLTQCPISSCKHPRSKEDGTPHAQHSYIPVAHRLRLMYSDKWRAREMMSYRAKMDAEMETEVCTLANLTWACCFKL